jgi:SAM-dependent methyltransferase
MARWVDFVDPERRLQTERPFLYDLLTGSRLEVFDAGLGMGVEATFFAKRGCIVTGNEISEGFRNLARTYAAKYGVNFEITSVDWRELDLTFGRSGFDLLLLLGNSFCLLPDPDDRILVARNLRRICRDGGRLVIDQRNFDYILNNRREILNGHFRYTGSVMFCGRVVIGRPVLITSQRVRFAYGEPRKEPLGYLDMYPAQMGEMQAIFSEAGFRDVRIFSDFTPGYRGDADFYEYIMK